MGRHVWFRTPTKEDRKDIFDLYLDRVAHDLDLDTPERRDEIARITNGYSPAMIEQICVDGADERAPRRQSAFTWQHLVDAMTVVESGTAIGIRYIAQRDPRDRDPRGRSRLTAHIYRPEIESSRLSIRMRGGSLGHHQAFEKRGAIQQWQSEEMGDLDPHGRRDGGRASSSTARTQTVSAATSASSTSGRGDTWSAWRAWRPRHRAPRRDRERAMKTRRARRSKSASRISATA